MYWGQISVSLMMATIVAYLSSQEGFGIIGVLAIFVISYSLVRWAIAWFHRVNFWHHTDSNRDTRCNNCNQYIYRQAGDFVPQCKRCGEKQGLPVVRLFTRSVAAVQLKRTVHGPLLVIVVVSALAVAGAATASFEDPEPQEAVEVVSSANSSALTETEDVENAGRDYNREKARELLVEELNKARQEKGLASVNPSDELREVAQAHSEDMVNRGFFAHTNPDGLGPHDRITQKMRCTSTGENIAQSHWDTNVIDQERIESNEDLAEVIIQQWIDSPPHRENLFRSDWVYVGHGISFDGDAIYITQKFCNP